MFEKYKSLKYLATFFIFVFGFIITNTNERYWLLQEKILEQEIHEAKKVAKYIDPKQIACMAKNIFYEAGGEPLLGQAAVARVVMNRINHGFAKTPCAVIYQANYVERPNEKGDTQTVKLCQFSWVCEGKEEPHKNNPRYQQAKQIAYDVMVNNAYNDILPKSTLFFHNTTVEPNWPYKQVKTIGNHVFYSKQRKQQNDTKKI